MPYSEVEPIRRQYKKLCLREQTMETTHGTTSETKTTNGASFMGTRKQSDVITRSK